MAGDKKEPQVVINTPREGPEEWYVGADYIRHAALHGGKWQEVTLAGGKVFQAHTVDMQVLRSMSSRVKDAGKLLDGIEDSLSDYGQGYHLQLRQEEDGTAKILVPANEFEKFKEVSAQGERNLPHIEPKAQWKSSSFSGLDKDVMASLAAIKGSMAGVVQGGATINRDVLGELSSVVHGGRLNRAAEEAQRFATANVASAPTRSMDTPRVEKDKDGVETETPVRGA